MWPEGLAWLDAALVMASGVVAFSLVGTLGYAYGEIVHKSLGAGTMIGATLVTGVITTFIAIMVGYYVAVVSSRFGLDPDNKAVPTITSVMDLAGIVTFLVVLSMFGVGVR